MLSRSKVGIETIRFFVSEFLYLFPDEILIVGGDGEYMTERCNYDSGVMKCKLQNPELNYYWDPEVFAVADDFCP